MSRRVRYIGYGAVMMVAAIILAYVIASSFDFSWLVISMVFLTILTIGLLTNIVPTEGDSGPTMHSNWGSGETYETTPHDVAVLEHIMQEDQPTDDGEPVPADKRFLLMSLIPGIAMVVTLVAWVGRLVFL